MNILYITHCDPRLTSYGSAQRSHYLWESLKKVGTVYTVYNVGPTETPFLDEENRIASSSFAPKGYVKLHLFALVNQIFAPFVWPFRSSRYLKRQMPWKDVDFDRVVVRYIGGVAQTNAWRFGSVYVDIDDLPLESYNTIRRKGKIPPFGWIGSKIVSWWQKYILKKCCAAWIASPAQVEVIAKILPCAALPNLPVMPREGYRVNGAQKMQLMTVGLMSYEPNYQGVDWFVENVWSSVHRRFPELKYKICGKGAPEALAKKWTHIPGVEVAGFVDDLDKVYEESIAVVTPIMSGAGTCIKVPEAAVRGRKIFATPFAARGISADCMSALKIFVGEKPEEMAGAIAKWIREAECMRETSQQEVAETGRGLFSKDIFESSVRGIVE